MGSPTPPVPIAIRVTQTASVVTVTQFTAESTSTSQHVQLAKLRIIDGGSPGPMRTLHAKASATEVARTTGPLRLYLEGMATV